MIIEGNHIIAEEGKTLFRKEDCTFVGQDYYLGYIYYMNGKKLDEPKQETPEDFEELTQEQVYQEKLKQYPLLVETYIRERYSVSDELALQRQRKSKPDAFYNYYLFCEECKSRARQELGLQSKE